MCVELNSIFTNPTSDVIIMKGAGDRLVNSFSCKLHVYITYNVGRAFCAGGDVKTCYQSILDSSDFVGTGKPGLVSSDFFREEYIMNYNIGRSPVPQVSIWNGFVSSYY